MTILPIIKSDIAALSKVSEEWDFTNPPQDPIQLAHDLADTMLDARGLGLAAIQVGLPYRVFAMIGSIAEETGKAEIYCFFNPRIVTYSNTMVRLEEGCLSWPGLIFNIDRPRDVRFRFTLPNGQTDTKTFTGITARVVQHEMLHLDGKMFWQGIKRYKIEKIIKRAKKKGWNYEGQGLLKFAA